MKKDDLPKPNFFKRKKALYYILPALVILGFVVFNIGSKAERAQTVTKIEADSQAALCMELSTFLESNEHLECSELQAIVGRVEEIKARIVGMANGGEINSKGSFPQDKVEKVQKCVVELQAELQKIFGIHQMIAARWEAQKIGEGVSQEIIQPVVEIILSEYQERWSNMS